MQFKLHFYLLCLFILASCSPTKEKLIQGPLKVTIPDADIVFYTIEKGKPGDNQGNELIGFYKFSDQQIAEVNFDTNLIKPIMLGNDTLVAIQKRGSPGTLDDGSGYLYVFRNGEYTKCKYSSSFGSYITTNGESVFITAINGINVIDIDDCSSETILTDTDILTVFSIKPYLGSFSISKDLNLMILSSYNRLVKVNLPEKEFQDYHKSGNHPTLSPDGSKVAYISDDGIHIMDINGENDLMIVELSDSYQAGGDPVPIWSSNGNQLIYHKCTLPKDNSCLSIEDYSVFIFDIVTGVETHIINGGINPSFIN
jgi:hypothetical protein